MTFVVAKFSYALLTWAGPPVAADSAVGGLGLLRMWVQGPLEEEHNSYADGFDLRGGRGNESGLIKDSLQPKEKG